MIRMLVIGYVFAIRSERALCREVQVNLAYRWFCGLSIEDKVPDHSAFSRVRNERFCDSDLFRTVFERVVAACIRAGLVGGESFAVDASLIVADANKQRSIPGAKWSKKLDPQEASLAAKEYLKDYPAVIEFDSPEQLARVLADRSYIARLRQAAWNARQNYSAARHGADLQRFLEQLLGLGESVSDPNQRSLHERLAA